MHPSMPSLMSAAISPPPTLAFSELVFIWFRLLEFVFVELTRDCCPSGCPGAAVSPGALRF